MPDKVRNPQRPTPAGELNTLQQGTEPLSMFRAAVEASFSMVVVANSDGIIEYVNPRTQEVSGYSASELIGRPIQVLGGLPAAEEQAIWSVVSADGTWHGDVRGERKDGTCYWASVSITPVRSDNGETTHFVGISLDITERKRSEDALRDSEADFRMLFDDTPAMSFRVAADGTVLSVNRFGAEALGYSPEELTGKPVLGVFHADDRRAVSAQLKLCLSNPGAVHQWEGRKRRKSGEVLWVRETARATTDQRGRAVVLVVCEDITEQKQMEVELEALREDLAARAEAHYERGRNEYGLSFREVMALGLAASGKSDKEIATALGIRPMTASKHVTNVLRKMNAASRAQAVARAVRDGII